MSESNDPKCDLDPLSTTTAITTRKSSVDSPSNSQPSTPVTVPISSSAESPSHHQDQLIVPSSPVLLTSPTSSTSSKSSGGSSLIMFRLDPCGFVCILITYLSVFYADYVVVRWICLVNFHESVWCIIHILGFNLIVLMLAWSHLRAVISDPGIIELPDSRLDFSEYYEAMKEKMDAKSSSGDMEDDFNDWTVCARCEVYRPPRAHHCRICKRCVRRMDHHCPWINNCVGQWNQKYFIQFLIYVGVLCTYASVLVLYAWTTSNCLPSGNGKGCAKMDLMDKQSKVLHSVILMLECIIFGMFILAILIDQLTAIFTDCSAVEQVKRRTATYQNNHNNPHGDSSNSTSIHRSSCPPPTKKSKLKLLGEVCGRGPIYYWFLPFHNNSFHQQQKVQEQKRRRNYADSSNSSNSGYFNV